MAFVLKPPDEREKVAIYQQLSALGRSIRIASICRAVAWLIALPLILGLMVCLLDSSNSLSSLVRAFGLAMTLAIAGLVFFVHVRPSFRNRYTALDIAKTVERDHPEFQDSLGSAVSFNNEDESQFGSPKLRAITVRRAQNQLRDVNLDRLVPSSKAIIAVLSAIAVMIAIIACFIISPSRSGLAVVRFLDPFGQHPWPAKTTIRMLSPEHDPFRMAKGDSLSIVFQVSGIVPEVGQFQLHLINQPQATTLTEPAPLKADGPTTLLLDASRIPADFEFRLIANDADTGWRRVDVAPPPRLVPRDGRPSPQVSIEPPLYSKLPASDLPDGTGVIESVTGTRIRLAAQTDRRIVSAAIKPHGELSQTLLAAQLSPIGAHPLFARATPLMAQLYSEPVNVDVSGQDGTRLDIDFIPRWNGLHALTFTDESGLTGTRLIDLRFYPDPSPAVTLDRPAAEKDSLLLLPTASIILEARADDRTFGLRKVWLEYRYDKEAEQSIRIADYPTLRQTLPAFMGGFWTDPQPTTSFATLSGMMPLSRFRHSDGRVPGDGDRLTLQSVADDWDDVSVMKLPGRSREVTIRIVNRQTLESVLQKNLVEMRQPLKQTLEQEKEAKKLVDDVTRKLEKGEPLTPQDRESLDRAAQTLAQAKGRLTSPQDGLKDRMNELQRAVAANDLPPKGTAGQIESSSRTMNRLANDNLDNAEAALNAARRETDPAKIAAALEQFNKNQQTTINGLKSVVEKLDQWGSAAELRSDAQQLKNKLANVGEGMKDPAQSKTTTDDLNKLAGDANQLMDRAAAMAKEKQAAGGEKSQAEANAIRNAIEQSGGAQVGEELRNAADATKAGRTNEAEAQRQSAMNRLNQMTEALKEKDKEPSVDELKKNRKQDLADLNALKEQQDELKKKSKAIEQSQPTTPQGIEEKKQALESLSREQERLQKDAEKLAEKLTRDRAEKTADRVRQAADQMAQAAERQRQGKPAGEEQEQAEQQLQKAQQEFPKETKESDEQLEREEREQWIEQIKNFRERQKNAITEMNRLLNESIQQGSWDRPKLSSLADLVNVEQKLADDVKAFQEKHLEPYPIFGKLAERATGNLVKAAKRITERKDDLLSADANAAFDRETETLAHKRPLQPMIAAMKAFDVLMDALKPDDKKKPQANGDAPMPMEKPEESPMEGGPQQKGIPPLAQLKVLRALQADLNERTTEFHKANPDPEKYDDDAKAERDELEKDQKEIAELFEKLLPLLSGMPMEE